MLKKLAVLSLGALLLCGCATPGALVSMPPAPPPETDSVRFRVTLPPSVQLVDNVVQSVATPIPPGASVVISVPAQRYQQKDAQNSGAANQDSFGTDGYFNAAEQQIERSLMKNGFQVKDRSKFEAILRDLRDARFRDPYSRSLDDNLDPTARPLLRQLEEQLKRNEITVLQYNEAVEEIRGKYRASASSRNRGEGEREMTDISELIRAAGASDIQADYILQIPSFETGTSKDIRINLLGFQPVRDFNARHPDIQALLAGKQYYPCESLKANLNAKLIHVKTGNVAWIGNHEVSELDGKDSALELEFRYARQASNTENIQRFVNYQNLPTVRKARGNVVAMPPWEYRTELTGPTLVSGISCALQQRGRQQLGEVRDSLARRVAAELISTIKVGRMQ